jgi:hypothetical protein
LINTNAFGPDVTVNLVLASPTGGASLGTPSTAVLTIQNPNAPMFGSLEFSTSSYAVPGGSGLATISVVRTGGADGTVSINFQTVDGTAIAGVDYVATSGTLTFPNGVTTQTFAVPILAPPGVQGNRALGLVLSAPTGGASLGTPSTATLTIQDVVGPTVTNLSLLTNRQGITGIVVTFSEPLNPTRAVNPLNYNYGVQGHGRDTRFGTSDDVVVGFSSIVYDAASRSVTLTLSATVHRNAFLRLAINQVTDDPNVAVGVADLAGNLLDGNYSGQPGGVFVTQFALGNQLSYIDAQGNHVSLRLAGGGQIELFRGDNGNAQLLRLAGTVAGRSTLSGQVHKSPAGGNGLTPIPVIAGADSARIALTNPPFVIGTIARDSISAQAVDSLLTTGALSIGPRGNPAPLGRRNVPVRSFRSTTRG